MVKGNVTFTSDPEAQLEENVPAEKAPRRAIRSFENLVALANDAERFRDARKMVWRDRGEPAAELKTLEESLRHALRGALRAGTLGFGIRAGFNLFVLLFRILRLPKEFRISLIRRAIVGEDSFRFAAMIGSFVGIYKFLLNALPLITKYLPETTSAVDSESTDDLPILTKQGSVTRRLSVSARAHQEWVRKRTKRWHAIAAGAIAGGLGIMFEKKKRRVNIAQQLFVRGLQGGYNEFATRHNIKIPFGPVIVFSLCCGQIMYAFMLRPDTIPRGYSEWIQMASKTAPNTVSINRDLVREGRFDLKEMESIVNWKNTHPAVKPLLMEELERARRFGDFGPHYGSCAVVHPWLPSCWSVPADRFISVARWMFPIYGALHFIPMLLFKYGQVFKAPGQMLLRAFLGTARSSTFLGIYVIIYQSYFCMKHNLHAYLVSPNTPVKLPQKVVDLLIGKLSFWLGGLLSGLALFIEAKHRRPELAMYVLPKGLESAWRVASGKGIIAGPKKYGEALLCAIGMGMVMNAYQHNPQHLSGLVRRILYQFIGPN
ncbi:hypothetical protein M422DRAFT_219181 [Sphaerobolus stellatus SS14]|nr:hypothetical protein M422DRAFT_219181 [Sphaerobolus stellatus SS14]